MILDCIVCQRALESAVPAHLSYNQPYKATTFTSHGHYGSTVFDPMSDVYLEINVCDRCMRIAAAKRHVLVVQPQRPEPKEPIIKPWTAPEPWNPEEENKND